MIPLDSTTIRDESDAGVPPGDFSYSVAFSRHLGLINPEEQQRLRNSRIAIAGLGGVGGIHLITLARLGIGGFRIADPDRFDLGNFNRQYGATTHTIGRNKAEVMAEQAMAINPQLDLRIWPESISEQNVGALLEGVDVFVDGIDFFALEARRLLFREARRRGVWAITAGPIGFSTAWLVFSPTGMDFDRYFGLHDDMDRLDSLAAFLAGLTPQATQRTYMDLSQVETRSGRGPSAALACQLCGGVVAAEVVKILLGRRPIRPAPWYHQFDAYRQQLRRGRILGGGRNPWQRRKCRHLRAFLEQAGWDR